PAGRSPPAAPAPARGRPPPPRRPCPPATSSPWSSRSRRSAMWTGPSPSRRPARRSSCCCSSGSAPRGAPPEPVTGFVDVLLRGLALCGQAIAVGGVIFGWALLRPAVVRRPALGALLGRSLVATAAGAVVVACAQALSLGVQLVALGGDGGWPLREILATTYFRAAVVRVLACALLLIGGAVLRRRAGAGWLLQLVAVAGLVLAAAWTSHAAARVGPRALLLALDALHQLAAGVWIGGLAQLLVLACARRAP